MPELEHADTRTRSPWLADWTPSRLMLFLCHFELLVGISIILWEVPVEKGTAILWGVACFWAGGIAGFIFAIPKPASTKTHSRARLSTPRTRSDVNTNLGQISDWLTKAIVGIGLVNLTQMPELMNRFGAYIADGIPSVHNGHSLALAIVIYFGATGFFNGYVFTRIYTAPVFREADSFSNTSGLLENGNPGP